MKLPIAILLLASSALAQMRVAALPAQSPLVTFRIVFTAGAAADPADKPGVAYLTALMLAEGGSRQKTYQQILDAMYPMASSLRAQVDKEMTTFYGQTHVDNLDDYYALVRAMLLDPGWRDDDFKRVKDDAINAIRVGLRSNDEELGKEVLYHNIYAGTPYGHYTGGTVSSLEKITLEDLRHFYAAEYRQSNLILGLAGGYPPEFLERVKRDFQGLPKTAEARERSAPPAPIEANRAVIVDRDTRSVAYSIGFPIVPTRSHPDYPALLLAASFLGQHRMSGGRLYNRMRERRGLNYGDYAYIEYFPRGMYLMEPSPNLGRQQQIFQIWIRPVEPSTAKFALRLALYELNRFVRDGLSQAEFDRSRGFLMKYVNVLTRTKSAELGYAIDSLYYGMPNYNDTIKTALAKLTRTDVNRAIKRYLRADRLAIAAVSANGEALKKELASDEASPMKYNSPKPAEITEEDKTVETWPLDLKAADITVVRADQVFQ